MVIPNLKKLPYPGFRNIKTGIAILICLILYIPVNRDGVAFATIAILICMQDSVEKSISEGFNRVIGTVLGGSFGIIFIYFDLIKLHSIIYFTLCSLGVVLYIYICNLINIRKSINIGCVVYLMIVIGPVEDSPLLYSIYRTIDTIVGIIIAVVVNRHLFRPKPERFELSLLGKSYLRYDLKKLYQCNSSVWSGGTSTELYIYPRNSLESARDFDFRISTADITLEHSILAKYKGYMRQIMLLKGEMKILHEGFHTVTLDEFGQDYFKGDWNTQAYGKCVDLNLIYKNEYEGGLEPLRIKDKVNFNIKKVTGFYCLEDDIRIKITQNCEEILNLELKEKDFLFFRDDKNDSEQDYVVGLEYTNNIETEENKVVIIKVDVWKK